MFQVAVPLSPSSSSVDQHSEGALSINSLNISKFPNNNIQTTLSVIDLGISNDYLPRRSFSEDDIDLHHAIIDIQEDSDDSHHIEQLSFKLNSASKKKLQKINTIIWYRDFNETNQLLKKLTNEFTNNEIIQNSFYPLERKIYRVDNQSISFSPFNPQDNNTRMDVIKTWLQGVNLKSHDFMNRPVRRDQILIILTDKLKNINFNESRKSVRAKIVEVLDDLPINFYGTTRRTYLNRLANILLNRLQRINFGVDSSSVNRYKYVNLSQSGMTIFTSGIQPTEDELKVFVREELMDYVEKNKLEYHLNRINDIEADIIDILLDLMDDIKSDRDGNAKEEIICVLRETGMFAAQPEDLAIQILEQLKEMFNVVDESLITEKSQLKTESIIMYQHESLAYKEGTLDNESQTSYEDNLKLYTLKISLVIDEWLSDLGRHKLKICNKFNRQAIIDDLAEDIVDRFKYLELNPPKHYFYDDIEHLKYQVFKWMSKLTGENNLASLETAPDLMRRIRKIPLPIDAHNFKNANENQKEENGTDSVLRHISDRSSSTESFRQACYRSFSTPETSCTDRPVIMNTPRRMSQLSMFTSPKPGTERNNMSVKEPALNETVNYENPAKFSSIYVSLKKQDNLQVPKVLSSDPSASPSNLLSFSKSIKELNEEYDTFVRNWTEQIPIPSSTPEEQNLAKNLRTGVYNAVWKTVAKLKSHPSNIFNPFHYQDLLDDELEDIFKSLPQTEALLAKKHYLKVEFIEKTVNINDQIKMSFAPEIFKQNIVHNVMTHIPRTRTNVADENPVKLYEELEILELAQIYILYVRFKDEDQLRANVFRTKLVKRLQEVVDELKTIHQKELEHIGRDLYMNELLHAMQQVPLPSDNTIKAEADEILLGMEIEQWMEDLPLVTIENTRELFTRRRFKDNLAKKVHDLEKSVNISDSNGDRLLRMEISAFLDKLPLQRDQSLNLNFMVDELTNRIKNMPKYESSRVNTGLDANGSLSYTDFSGQVQKASSYNQMPVSNTYHPTSPDTKTLTSGTASSMALANHDSVPQAQPSNAVTEQTIPGKNTELSSGQVPSAQCKRNSNIMTISQWREASAGVADQLQGMQPQSNTSIPRDNQSQSIQPGPMLPPHQGIPLTSSPVAKSHETGESFRPLPSSTSTLRPQQAQTISIFDPSNTSALEPVPIVQPIPLQQRSSKQSGPILPQGQETSLSNLPVENSHGTGCNTHQSFQPPLISPLRPQQAQTISLFNPTDTSALDPVPAVQPIPLQQRLSMHSGPILPQRQEISLANSPVANSHITGCNAYQSFRPPLSSTLKPQQAQTISLFNPTDTSALYQPPVAPVPQSPTVQQIPLQQGLLMQSGQILRQRQATPMASSSVANSHGTGYNAYQSFQPPQNLTLRPQQAQTISLFNPTDTSALRPTGPNAVGIPTVQRIPLQQQSPLSAIADSSVYFGPQLNAPVQNPPLYYTSFAQQKPVSSSLYPGQEINQSNVQPSACYKCGSRNYVNNSESQHEAGRSNVLGQPNKMNQSHRGPVDSTDFYTLPTGSQHLLLRQDGVPSVADRSGQADNQRVINQTYQATSCGLECPSRAVLPSSSEPLSQLRQKFYRSTDPQGIKQFTEQNIKNRSQYDNQHNPQKKEVISEISACQGCCPQIGPANVQVSTSPVQHVSPCLGPVSTNQEGTNVQTMPSKLKQKSALPCPGKTCPNLKRAMETQCPAKDCFFDYNDWDEEELDIRCRCVERFKKSRIRRFGYENPIYRHYSPYFCFPHII